MAAIDEKRAQLGKTETGNKEVAHMIRFEPNRQNEFQ